MMNSIINGLRNILGNPDFYKQLNPNSTQFTWDYGALIEYVVGALILVIVVSYVFRIVMTWINGRR